MQAGSRLHRNHLHDTTPLATNSHPPPPSLLQPYLPDRTQPGGDSGLRLWAADGLGFVLAPTALPLSTLHTQPLGGSAGAAGAGSKEMPPFVANIYIKVSTLCLASLLGRSLQQPVSIWLRCYQALHCRACIVAVLYVGNAAMQYHLQHGNAQYQLACLLDVVHYCVTLRHNYLLPHCGPLSFLRSLHMQHPSHQPGVGRRWGWNLAFDASPAAAGSAGALQYIHHTSLGPVDSRQSGDAPEALLGPGPHTRPPTAPR